MAKNLFNYLNKHDAIWVDILYMKYGEHNFWTHQNPTNVSSFFKGMCTIANIIKHNLWINCVNPNCTSVLYHPYMFDVPIAMKPVYINMTINFENLQIVDLLNHLSWNVQSLNWLIGYGWVSPVISHGKITPVHWVWFPKTNSNIIFVALYNSINNKACYNTNWDGWSVIWKLSVAPRGKTFIWLLLHVKVQIYDFVYNLHMGPPDHCVFLWSRARNC